MKMIMGLIKSQPATPLFSAWVRSLEYLFTDIFVLELIFNTGFDSLESFGFSDGLTSKSRWKSYTITFFCCISTFDGSFFLPRSAVICFPPPGLWVSSAASPVGKKLVLTHCCQQDAHCKHERDMWISRPVTHAVKLWQMTFNVQEWGQISVLGLTWE